MSKKFSTATKYIQEIGTSDFAKYDEHGSAAGTAVFPFSLRFAPTSQVKNLFPASAPKDPLAYMQQLPTVPKNAALYTVYAMDKPKELGGKETMIGTLQLNGGLIASKWADENLFFRHQYMDEDIKLHGEWDKYTAKCPFL